MANPPFSHQQRDATYQQTVTAPVASNPFIGGWQPLAPRKFPPSLLSVDSPPAYLPELVVLEPEDMAAYFRAQRWPWQKIIVSVDNPPFGHYARRVGLQASILKAWEPLPPLPQQPNCKQYPISTNQAAAFSSIGAGLATWIGSSVQQFVPKPAFQKHILSAWETPVVITITLPQLAAGLSQGAFSSIGVGTSAWVGSSVPNTAPRTFLQSHIIRAWDVPTTIQQRRNFVPQVAAVSASGAFSSVGIGTDVWVGKSAASASASSAGVGTDTWVGALSQNSAPRVVTQAQIIAAWAPQYLIQQPRRFTPQIAATSTTGNFFSLGLGLATWAGAETATATFSSSGHGTATFVGKVKSSAAPRFDGWKPQREQIRRRKDEDEIVAIVAAALPIIQSGTLRAPMRLSIPRNVRSLH